MHEELLKIFTLDIVANTGITVPEMINYTQLGLFKKITMDKGLVTKNEFYRYYDPNTNEYSDLFVKESFTYIEQNPLYLGYVTLSEWYDTEDQVGHSKEFTRMFTSPEIIDFGIKKRSNVVANAKLYAFQTIGQANAYALLDYCQAEISIYVQGNTPPIVARVNSSVGVVPGMTQPVADAINSILTDL